LRGGIGGFISSFVNAISNTFENNLISSLASAANSDSSQVTTSENPGEEHMAFTELSLRQRYEKDVDGRVNFIKTQLAAQKAKQTAYWKSDAIRLESNRGLAGGLKAGDVISPNARGHSHFGTTQYFNDTVNSGRGGQNIYPSPGSQVVPDGVKRANGQDFIYVFFYDFVNQVTIPFRAFITNISENVSPEVSDTRYIGRLERNVVYVGVTRELSLTLRVQSFSSDDLENIWEKINYMTGLCYPSQYINGFMVPPFVKLTIGDIYKDQPGYIKSINHQIEDDISWEIAKGSQAPHGVLISLTFSCMEKSALTSTSTFYPITSPINKQVR
jgi:hypothetical protein